MEKIVFADTLKKIGKGVLKVPVVIIDDPIFRVHYKATGLALLFFSVLVSGYQFFGNPIMCIQRDDIPEKLLNTYCWIEGTFTLPKALNKTVGTEIVYPGVEKYQHGDDVIEHAYYQWVCFLFLLQAFMFYVPYILWKMCEGGRMKNLIQKLKNPILNEAEKKTNCKELATYFANRKYQHQQYALKYLGCEILNFVNVIGQIYFLDKFLGHQFTTYGADVIRYVNEEQENRVDPMIKVFPRVTKCTFHRYGSSGDVQKHDALCLLPLNILNEKLFVIMWFWLVILAVLGAVLLVYRFFIVFSSRARFLLLNCVSSLTSMKELKSVISSLSYGDWFVLYMLADNIDNVHFRDFIMKLQTENICCFPKKKETNFYEKNKETNDGSADTLLPKSDTPKVLMPKFEYPKSKGSKSQV